MAEPHGFYTQSLLDELAGTEPKSISEVFVGISKRLGKKTEVLGSKMTPQRREISVENGEFVFIPKVANRHDLASESPSFFKRLLGLRGNAETSRTDVLLASTTRNYRQSIKAQVREVAWQGRFERFKENASTGDPLAMAGLFHCSWKALGTETNLGQAFIWATRSHEAGIPEGKHALGLSLINGVGVEKNVVAGELLLRDAVKDGLPESMYELAISRSRGGEDGFGEAFDLLRDARVRRSDANSAAGADD